MNKRIIIWALFQKFENNFAFGKGKLGSSFVISPNSNLIYPHTSPTSFFHQAPLISFPISDPKPLSLALSSAIGGHIRAPLFRSSSQIYISPPPQHKESAALDIRSLALSKPSLPLTPKASSSSPMATRDLLHL